MVRLRTTKTYTQWGHWHIISNSIQSIRNTELKKEKTRKASNKNMVTWYIDRNIVFLSTLWCIRCDRNCRGYFFVSIFYTNVCRFSCYMFNISHPYVLLRRSCSHVWNWRFQKKRRMNWMGAHTRKALFPFFICHLLNPDKKITSKCCDISATMLNTRTSHIAHMHRTAHTHTCQCDIRMGQHWWKPTAGKSIKQKEKCYIFIWWKLKNKLQLLFSIERFILFVLSLNGKLSSRWCMTKAKSREEKKRRIKEKM